MIEKIYSKINKEKLLHLIHRPQAITDETYRKDIVDAEIEKKRES